MATSPSSTPKSSNQLTLFAEVFPVNQSPAPADGGARRTRGGSGPSSPRCFAWFDRATSSLKIPQASFLPMEDGPSRKSLVIWPRSGTMRNGVCWEPGKSEHPTGGTGCLSWPTPTAIDAGSGRVNRSASPGAAERPTPARLVKTWPTPRASDGEKGGPNQRDSSGAPALASMATWPTPNATDYKGPSTRALGKERPECDDDLPTRLARRWPTPTTADGMGGPGNSGRDGGENLRTVVQGQLSPDWTELLMGFPLNWTRL